ncbi:MAG: hypothetical protein VX589_03935 [Myxococcota bacterium]|nr:hypothetical protein [Myxococcota bacterium]
MRVFAIVLATLVSGVFALGCSSDPADVSGPPTVSVQTDNFENPSAFLITLSPGLSADMQVYARVRSGDAGVLNCAQQRADLERIDGRVVAETDDGVVFRGPSASMSHFKTPYTNAWVEAEPTAEMIANVRAQIYTLEICIMKGDAVIRRIEMDTARAQDRRGGSGKFDGYGEDGERIVSVSAYAEACISQLGEIPFFKKIEDGDYETFNCLDATPIPMTVTKEDGTVEYPSEVVTECDNPQFIYNSCEPNAVTGETNGPRVTSDQNADGTHWVLLCRKALEEEGKYNDVAMLGHNPYTGKTCFFQNALYSKTDGDRIPHPGDTTESSASPETSTSLWNGIHGGRGSGIECADCHDADPIIHTPWIDGAKRENGDPVVPKLGIHAGLIQGFNEAPYTIVNTEAQGWKMPKVLNSPEAAPCTKCHRIGDGRWAATYMERMEGKSTFWNTIVTDHGKKFSNLFWMPPEISGLDESTWDASAYGKATAFIQDCTRNPSQPQCKWEDLPTEQIIDVGELPSIELAGKELALEALKILGARVYDSADPRCDNEDGSCANRRCGECHSVSKASIRHWASLTADAKSKCGLDQSPDMMTQAEAQKAVDCMRARPEDPNSVFAADKIGILTTGARYTYFRELFRKAYGNEAEGAKDENAWVAPFLEFRARIGMPKGVYPTLSQHEYAVLLKWFDGDLENLDDVIQDPPAPATCDDFNDADFFKTHTDMMAVDGWGAINQENGIRMFGCNTARAADCFSSGYADVTGRWGGKDGLLREVLKLNFKTSFWTRSSADGRFIANGGGTGGGATVTDMARSNPDGSAGFDIKIDASYDPGFFPDNSGFIFQGGGTGICSQSILETEDEVDFEEEGCMRGTNINLYQHVARGVNGGDYFVINSQFTSDSGRTTGARNPRATFNADSTMKFSPMIFDGRQYVQLPAKVVGSPFEGDSVLSPSGRLVVSRLAGGENDSSLGYVIREVQTEKFETNYKVDIGRVVARICRDGAKANISYDERFMVTHVYGTDGTADILLFDLVTGLEYQVTTMPAGSKALFPHFRSDNWFYFLVRSGDEEYVIASDLAVRLKATQGL